MGQTVIKDLATAVVSFDSLSNGIYLSNDARYVSLPFATFATDAVLFIKVGDSAFAIGMDNRSRIVMAIKYRDYSWRTI